MSWKPAFEIGLWNAWILMLFVILHPFIMNYVDMVVGTGEIRRKMGETSAEEPREKTIPIPTILLIVIFIYSIFLPLMLYTIWFYIGLAIYLVGIVVFLDAIIIAAKTPLGQVFSSGIYRYSRHPLYLSFMIIYIGISLATVSWLFLLLSMGWMILPLSQVNAEEQGCLEPFGTNYQEYMLRTPKWLGIPKPGKTSVQLEP